MAESPFAPLWGWLKRSMRGYHALMTPHGYVPVADAVSHPDLMRVIDLRDLPTRAVVLRALAPIYEARRLLPPHWALGEGWSALTAEQAGRVVAEMVRRVGADPAVVGEVLPVGVRGPYRRQGDRSWREVVAGDPSSDCWSSLKGEAGEREADEMGRAKGTLLWEEITP